MCGRFVQHSPNREYAGMLGLEDLPEEEGVPNYNISPTQQVLAVRSDDFGRREMVRLRWGLVPNWSQGPDSRYSMINARAETVHQRPAYRAAFKYRRCLIPADGFYEWKAGAGGKQPYFIRSRDGRPFAFAGLWEHWEGTQGSVIDSCTIIVTEANQSIRSVHERMPVIVSPGDYGFWLDPASDRDALRALLAPFADALEIYPVSRKVNNPRSQGPDLLRAAPGDAG